MRLTEEEAEGEIDGLSEAKTGEGNESSIIGSTPPCQSLPGTSSGTPQQTQKNKQQNNSSSEITTEEIKILIEQKNERIQQQHQQINTTQPFNSLIESTQTLIPRESSLSAQNCWQMDAAALGLTTGMGSSAATMHGGNIYSTI